MIYFYAFILSGFVCLIAQIIMDNSSFTAGHVTSLFTCIGAFLSFLGIYPYLLEKCGGGAGVLIMNFGNMLYQSGINGYEKIGAIGIFTDLLNKSSAAIVSAVIFAFIIMILFKPKN